METIKVETINGQYETNVYNIKDFPYDDLLLQPTVRKKNRNYYNISVAFDIETTTIDGIKDDKNKYIKSPFGFMYQWQFCIDKKVIFGRTWYEFQYLLKKLVDVMELNDKNILVIYVHNLSFEFQFMKEFINIKSIFAREKRKVLKCNTTDGIEFRCSYFLSNMSLAKFCENSQGCTHYKLEDKYDYTKVRTPETDLTPLEKSYCFNDVYGLCECINFMLKDDTIATIPLTNTGYVRREYRTAMNKNPKNRFNFTKTQLTPELYNMLKRAFRGGNTHANRYVAGGILNNVHSYDIASSYPASMMLDDYPTGKFTKVTITNSEKLKYYSRNYCCLFDITFFNISCKNDVAIPYIDISHCRDSVGIVNDNGRVLQADTITLTLTNLDLDIIQRTYNFDYFNIDVSYIAQKGNLPNELRNKLLHFYYLKSTLKGIATKEYEYMKSKNRLNSTFGMCVTDMIHTEITYNQFNFEWGEEIPDINDALKDFYDSRNNFLSYQWGVWVTANARARLQKMLDIVGLDVVYIDTDSIKFQNESHIKEFEKVNEEIKKQDENNDINGYIDYNNKRYYLGVWDYEGKYDRFKTLGAKKYCFEKNGKFETTVAGMSKKKGAQAVKKCDNFIIGKTFNNVGRTTSWYNDEKKHNIEIDGCTILTASNIGILETSYTLGVTNEYYEIIGKNLCDDFI